MNANFQVYGTCRSRIYFEPFLNKDRKKEPESTDGIRCHNWLTALFLRCFGKISVLKLESGKVIYLNKASYDKWKAAKYAEVEIAPAPGLSVEQTINKLCAAKIARYADQLYQANQPDRAYDYLQGAGDIDDTASSYYYDRSYAVDCVERTTKKEFPPNNPPLKRAKVVADFRQLKASLDALQQKHKEAQATTNRPHTQAQNAFSALSRVYTATHKALFKSPIEDLFDTCRKELGTYEAELKLSEIEKRSGDEDIVLMYREKIKKYDPQAKLPESQGINSLINKFNLRRLSQVVESLSSRINAIYNNALKQDQERIRLCEPLEKGISNALRGYDFITANSLLDQLALVTLDKKKVEARKQNLQKLHGWIQLLNPEAIKFQENEKLHSEIKEKLERLKQKFDSKNPTAYQTACVKVAEALGWLYGEMQKPGNAGKQLSLLAAPSIAGDVGKMSHEIVRLMDFDFKDFQNSRLEDIAREAEESDRPFIVPLQQRVALLAFPKQREKVKEFCKAYLSAKKLQGEGEEALSQKNIEKAVSKYAEAANIALISPLFKVECSSILTNLYELQAWAKDKHVEDSDVREAVQNQNECLKNLKVTVAKFQKAKPGRLVEAINGYKRLCESLQKAAESCDFSIVSEADLGKNFIKKPKPPVSFPALEQSLPPAAKGIFENYKQHHIRTEIRKLCLEVNESAVKDYDILVKFDAIRKD